MKLIKNKWPIISSVLYPLIFGVIMYKCSLERMTDKIKTLSFNINRLSEFAFITKVDDNGGLPGWAIALIIFGAILVTCCLAFVLLFFVFNKWIKDENDENKALRVFKCGMKEGKVRLLRPSFKLVYREKEEVYKTKKDALDK